MLSKDIIATILVVGAGQGVLLAVALATLARGNRTANRLLAALLALFALSMVMHAFAHTKQLFFLPHHTGFGMASFLLYGPLLFLYARTIGEAGFRFDRRQWRHFVAAGVAVAIYAMHIFFTGDAHEHIIHKALAMIVVLHLLFYAVLTMQRLHFYNKERQTTGETVRHIKLRWLRFLVSGYLATWLLAFGMEGRGAEQGSWDAVWIAVSVFLYLIGYQGLRQPEIFMAPTDEKKQLPGTKYRKSTLSVELADRYHQRLLHLMEHEKLYLQSDLTLPLLAKKLSVSTHHLSQVINEKRRQNFFDFVNSYRIAEAQNLIRNTASHHKTLAEIGFEVGFNSITSFNSAFKKHAGMTPSQWRDGDAGG